MNKIIQSNIVSHIVFWVVYIVLWSVHDLVYYRNLLSTLATNLYAFLPYVLLVYFNLYVLMPNLLLKKRIRAYLLLISLGIVVTTFISSWNMHFYFSNLVDDALETAAFFMSPQGKISILTDILILVAFSMTLFLLREWHQKERFVREVNQKRLEAELNLLKNQINPHFLFNSLNSIYVMLDKNLEAGKSTLLRFSDILSHQLYETNKEKVSLTKEIDNLNNYINIEKIRHDDLVNVCVDLPSDSGQLEISPMLLLPLVENAFKHGQSSNGYWVKVLAKISEGNTLDFMVENSIGTLAPTDNNHRNGIGLQNVRRRLELIYPNKYELKVEDKSSIFKVNLKLELNGLKMHTG